MGTIVEYDPSSLGAAASAARGQVALSGAPVYLRDQEERLGVIGTAYETWMQETWIGSWMRYGFMPDDRSPWNYEFNDFGFNPYRYYLDNRNEYMDIDHLVKDGAFDGVITEAQFRDRAARLQEEMENRQRIANGSTIGMLAGGLLSFADVSTFVPGIGWGKKALTATRIGNRLLNSTSLAGRAIRSRPMQFAIAGGYYSAIQEAGLHTMQELRTLDESVYNTAGGAIFGGALGGLAVAASRTSPLHPANPNYVFRPDSPLTMGVRRMGDSLSESVVLQPVIRNGERAYRVVAENPTTQSLSAAARERADILRGRVDAAAGVGRKAVSAVGRAGQATLANTVGRASPVISGLMSKSAKMREITEGLFDLGGIITTGHAKGQYRASVEDIASRVEGHFNSNVMVRSQETFQDLQLRLAELGKLPSNAAVRAARNVVSSTTEFGRELARPASRSGEARQPSAYDGNNFRFWEFEDVIRRAAYDDLTNDVVANLRNRFGDEGADAIIAAARDIAEETHAFNKAVEDKMVELGMIAENQRMGRDYVAPQFWDGKGIHQNREAARAFFIEVFAGKPPEEFLSAYGLDEATFAKLGNEEVTITRNGQQETLSPERGLEARLEILDDWTADTRADKIAAMEANLKAAESTAQTTRRAAILAARELRKNVTDITKASVDEAVQIMRARQADRASAQRRLEIMRLTKRRVNTELALLKAEADALASLKPNAGRDINRLKRTRGAEVQEAEQLLKMIEADPDALPADIAFARQNLTAADNNLWRAAEDGAAVARARAEGRPLRSPNLSRLRERLRTIERDIYRTESQINRLDAKLEPLRRAADEATAARKAAQAARKTLREARKKTASADRQAQRKVRILERRLERAEQKETLGEYVDQLVDTLASRRSSRTPLGKLEGEVFESGRAKSRMIKLTADQRRQAQSMGLLRSDLLNSMIEGVSETSKRIAFREVFGHYGTTEQKILDGMKKDVREDYNSLISAARKAGRSDRHIRSLEKTRDRHVQYVENGVLRQLGLLGLPENSESILHWGLAKAREWNFIRYGSGFLIPSLTDLANVTMTTGFGTFSYRNLRGVNKTIAGMGNDEIRRLTYAMELLMHNSRNIKMNNGDDFRRMAGIGNYGTITHKTTATIDQVSSGLSRGTSYASGMLWWNSRLKMLAMTELQHNFTRLAGRYDELSAAASAGDRAAGLEIAKLASLGLGSDQMRNIQRMFAKHPPTETDGILELGMGRWLDEGEAGQRAYQDVLMALEHVANRAVMTPGKGDTPFLMSSEYGKTLMQFQTYGFVIMTRFMMPAFQRMATYGDMDAFLSFGLALALGSGVVAAKDLIRDGEIKERSAAQWGYDVIDRSGFLTYLSTPSAQVMRFFDAEASRYSNERNRFALVGGPTGGLVQDLMDLGGAVGEGDLERMGRTGQKLMPFRVFAQIYDVITGGD